MLYKTHNKQSQKPSEKLGEKYLYHKELLSLIYVKELLKLKKKTKNTIEKCAKDMDNS